MKIVFGFLGLFAASFCNSQTSTLLSLNFDDSSDTVVLDTIYPGNCWQIGKPLKPVFTAAFSGDRALVTDTIYPYADSTICYAEMWLISPSTFLEGRWLEFWHKIDTDQNSFGQLELFNDVDSIWYPFDTIFDSSINSGFGNVQAALGYNGPYAGQDSSWKQVEIMLDCLLLFDPNNPESWGSDSLKMRFAFHAGANPDSLDGWMIDSIAARSFTCVGSVLEHIAVDIESFPSPTTTVLNTQIDMPIGTPFWYSVFNTSGQLIASKPEHRYSGLFEVAVSDLPNGIYSLRVHTDNGNATVRFAVEH